MSEYVRVPATCVDLTSAEHLCADLRAKGYEAITEPAGYGAYSVECAVDRPCANTLAEYIAHMDGVITVGAFHNAEGHSTVTIGGSAIGCDLNGKDRRYRLLGPGEIPITMTAVQLAESRKPST